MNAYIAVLALVAVCASAGYHGGHHLHASVVSPGGHHAHADTHYVKVPVVGHKIVKQPVITYVSKAVPVLKVGVKPVHTITSIREEPLLVFNNPIPSLVNGPGISLVGGYGGNYGLGGGHGWW